jgi:hypothetical protein
MGGTAGQSWQKMWKYGAVLAIDLSNSFQFSVPA